MTTHNCFDKEYVHYKDFHRTCFLETAHWEFAIYQCKRCGQHYLHAYRETIGYPQSGLWVMGEVDDDFTGQQMDEQDLLLLLYNMGFLYAGGSASVKQSWSEKHERSPVYLNLKQSIYRK